MLGSSGEHLPVTRQAQQESGSSRFSSCESSEEEFHSAKTSLDEGKCCGKSLRKGWFMFVITGSGDEDIRNKNYNLDLETRETRCAFAQRLKDALRREAQDNTSSSSDSSYAVGISVTGAGIEDQNIKYLSKASSLDSHFNRSVV